MTEGAQLNREPGVGTAHPLALHDRVAAHPLCAVTPASAARPPRAVPHATA